MGMARPERCSFLKNQSAALGLVFSCVMFGGFANEAKAVDSGTVNALSMATVAFGATNVISGGADCVCKASSAGTCTPMLPWAGCEMMPMSVMTLTSSLATMAQNADSAEKFDSNGGKPKTPPTAMGKGGVLTKKPQPLDWGQFCSQSSEFCNDCAKSGDFSDCKPAMVLPSGVDRGAFNTPELQEALSAFDQAAEYVNANSDPALLAELSDESGFDGEGSGGSDPLYVKKDKNGPGKQDGEGLGKASMWGMDMIDEKTGAKLTLWQRATRRYYAAPELKRLNFLARAEFVRSRAIEHAKSKLKVPVRAELRAPASVDRAQTKKSVSDVSQSVALPPKAPVKY